MGREITLERYPGKKSFRYGDITFKPDGTLKFDGRQITAAEVPEEGISVKGFVLARGDGDVLAVKASNRTLIICFEHGGWYYANLERNQPELRE